MFVIGSINSIGQVAGMSRDHCAFHQWWFKDEEGSILIPKPLIIRFIDYSCRI